LARNSQHIRPSTMTWISRILGFPLCQIWQEIHSTSDQVPWFGLDALSPRWSNYVTFGKCWNFQNKNLKENKFVVEKWRMFWNNILIFEMWSFKIICLLVKQLYYCRATLNKHPPMHHPLDAPNYSVVDESQLS
jgi:hypothetical protein